MVPTLFQDQKFDVAAFLKSAAAAITSANMFAPHQPPPPTLVPTTSAIPSASQHPPFTPIKPTYAPSGYGRQILIYDSRSFPGHRREFAYKTRFTNQSGLTTVYYRCMACRALRHRLCRILPKDKLPAVPCIAVKNDLLINDPDFPEASDHFCTPLTIEESNNRLKVTFERGLKRARMKLATEEPPQKTLAQEADIETPSQINFDSSFLWIKHNTNSIHDDTANSSSSCEDPSTSEGSKETGRSSGEPSDSGFENPPSVGPAESDDVDITEVDSKPEQQQQPSRLDSLLQRITAEREKSISPNENINSVSTTPCKTPNLIQNLSSFQTPTGIPQSRSPAIIQSHGRVNPMMQAPTPELISLLSLHSLAARLSKGSELLKALNQPPKAVHQTPHVHEIIDKYIKNNWDLPENAGNSRSAAELTCTMVLSLARHVPQAHMSMKEGKWARKDYMGEEVYGKTLAIIGLGRIGLEVASRMQAFGMKTVGFDPLVSNEEAAKRNIKWLSLEEIWPVADYITVHVPLIPQTRDLLNKETFAKCKKGVYIINVARGGIVNEQDLVEALNSGYVSGAAMDVFLEEPPTYRALIEHPRAICTPHLGASTLQAQQRVAVEIAENIIALNNGTGLFGAINAQALAAVLDETKAQYVKSATSLAHVLASLTTNNKNILVRYPAGADGLQKALTAGAIVGILQASGTAGLNLVNAEVNAIRDGITVKTEQVHGNELTVVAGSTSVTGYPSPAGTIISAINGSKVPVPIVAAGTLAIAVATNGNQPILPEKLRAKLSVEYGLIGGGRKKSLTGFHPDKSDL
uniref:D-3-phosphoglycerate dehydrogenase n=1 Tax=Acrobeloides nanus TaxID=290746 RepID=A0A914C4F7_9BILA